MTLSDRQIRDRQGLDFTITPFNHDQVQPASYDLRLSEHFWLPSNLRVNSVDPEDPPADHLLGDHIRAQEFQFHPGTFILGSTVELVSLTPNVVARIEGKSSLGRLGILVHATAGFIDPGFSGHLTLEMLNVSPWPITIRAGMLIAQLSIEHLHSPATSYYGAPGLQSRYQNQGPQPVPYRRKIR